MKVADADISLSPASVALVIADADGDEAGSRTYTISERREKPASDRMSNCAEADDILRLLLPVIEKIVSIFRNARYHHILSKNANACLKDTKSTTDQEGKHVLNITNSGKLNKPRNRNFGR